MVIYAIYIKDEEPVLHRERVRIRIYTVSLPQIPKRAWHSLVVSSLYTRARARLISGIARAREWGFEKKGKRSLYILSAVSRDNEKEFVELFIYFIFFFTSFRDETNVVYTIKLLMRALVYVIYYYIYEF